MDIRENRNREISNCFSFFKFVKIFLLGAQLKVINYYSLHIEDIFFFLLTLMGKYPAKVSLNYNVDNDGEVILSDGIEKKKLIASDDTVVFTIRYL